MPTEIKIYCKSCMECQKFNYRNTVNRSPLKRFTIRELCILLGKNKLHTTTYHPAKNGITERLNKTIKPVLAKFVNDSYDDWDVLIRIAISAYNNSLHSTIGMSPYKALFGRPPVLVADIILNNQLLSSTRIRDVSEYVIALRKNAEYLNRIISERTEKAQTK